MKKQNSLFAWLATTPPMLLLALFVLFSPVKGWATGVSSTPTVRNFTASLVADRIDLTWNNSNKLNLVPSDVTNNYVRASATNDGSITSLSVSEQGVLSASYNLTAAWGYAEFEMVLPGEDKSGVQSITWDYTGKPSGASFYPYFMQNSTWIAWAEGYPNPSKPGAIIWTSPEETTGEGFVSTPNRPFAEWIHGYHSNAFTGQNIHLIGFFVEADPEPISDNIEISNIYVNTSINWDAIKIVRKTGSEPTSVSDGTVIDIAAGSTGAYSDNSITPGNTYYYAVFAYEGSSWVKKAAASGIEVAALKEDVNLSITTTEVTIPVGGTFNLGVTTAGGYDGEISYSISPAGIISRDGMVVTGAEMGTATVTVTASATATYDGDSKTCTVHVVKNFAGDLSAVENAGTVTLDWFYNLPISLATAGDGITNGGSYSTSYEAGIRTFTYTLSNNSEGTKFGACDFKTPNVPNCKSFSFEYRGENNGTTPRIVPYAWLDGGAPNYGNIVANPVEVRSTWDEVTVTPSCNYNAGSSYINNGAISNFDFSAYPVGCVAFFPMANGNVSEGTLQLRNAYFQLINTNSLTSSVALVRKDGSAPADASDGVVRYTGAPTTFDDYSDLEAGHTYYYRVFATYNGYTYASNAISVTMPSVVKSNPELSLDPSSKTMVTGSTYTLIPNKAEGYDGTITYTVAPVSGVANVTSAGVITATGLGTATITVTAPETENYSEASTTFTVEVIALSLHQPGKYETPQGEGGYGATLKSVNSRNYEVYRFNFADSKGALFAGSTSTVTDGYALITDATSTESKGDNWVAVKPHDYQSGGPYSIGSEFLSISGYARIGNTDHIRLYVQGYDQFAFAGRDYHATGDHLVIKIDGVTQDSYTINTSDHISDRFTLTTNEPHIIEITASSNDYHNRVLGFSLRLPIDDTPRSVTYAKGNEAVTGDLPSNTSYAPLAEFTIPVQGNLAWSGHAFLGWSDGSNMYAAGDTYTMPSHNVTLTAQWADIHQPTKYETATLSGGYGRTLQTYNNREYEVYELKVNESKGALYAGPATAVIDGYQLFNNATNATEVIGDNWVFVKARDYSEDNHAFANEFSQLNSVSTLSPQSARLDNVSYVRLYVQGYDQFTFIGIDSYVDIASHYFVVNIDGVAQSYTPDKDHYNYTRFDLDASEPHIIEITGSSSDYHNRIFGFSLRLPVDVTPRAVTYDKGDEAVTGDLPVNGSYAQTETFDLPEKGNLAWEGHDFIGWSDGTNIYAPGETYTMPKHEVTFTAQWIAPVQVPTVTSLAFNNIYLPTSPGTIAFNIDGEEGDETCINISGRDTAEWKVKFTKGIYKVNLIYGTTSGGVNVTLKIFDGTTELTAFTKNDHHDDGSGIHVYEAKWDLDLRGLDEDKVYSVKVIDTWGDASSKPRVGTLNFNPVNPIALSDTPVRLDYENVTFSPGIDYLNVDGLEGDETCLDIKDQGHADWLVQITPGYFQISMLYGTPGGTVKVQVMIVDASTGQVVEGKTTSTDIHYSGTSFQAKWGIDLRTGIDPSKQYFVRVKDVFEGTGSCPKVAYIDMVSVDPITVSNSVKTRLYHNNVTTPYTIVPFDIENDGQNETCLFIGGNKKAEWLAKISPVKYKIHIRYGRTNSTNIQLSIIDANQTELWHSTVRTTPSTMYEVWEINDVDLSLVVSLSNEYIIRIKDVYDGTGSCPYIDYIDFIPQVTHTRSGLRVGDYGTVCLPYGVAHTDREGAELFEIEEWNENGTSLTLSELNSDEDMVAGRPYIFQATDATATFRYYPEGDPAEVLDPEDCNGLTGSYTKEIIEQSPDNFIIYNNKLYPVNNLAYVGANKAYIHRITNTTPSQVSRRRVTLTLYGEQVVTGIDQINNQSEIINQKLLINGQLIIIRDGKTYNALGQPVNQSTSKLVD